MGETTAIILAAGKGTRMRSPLPKVLHEVCGTSLLECVLEAVREAGISRILVVVGDRKEAVKERLKGLPVTFVEQQGQLGTAHAVMSARHLLTGLAGFVLVLNGDTPLIKPQTLKRLVAAHTEKGADVTLSTVALENPHGYGRILRNARGCIQGIIEESEASESERKIKEINVGMYVFSVTSLLEGLDAITPHNTKGEYYLTDIIGVFRESGKRIEGFEIANTAEVLGINTQQELSAVNRIKQNEIIHALMSWGVVFIDPGNTYIEDRVEIGEGTTIYPFTYIRKNVSIGRRCRIGPFVYLETGTKLGENVEIRNNINMAMGDCGLFSKIEGRYG